MKPSEKKHTLIMERRQRAFGLAWIAFCTCGWSGTAASEKSAAAKCWGPHLDRATNGGAK